jgi:hypothetical protein
MRWIVRRLRGDRGTVSAEYALVTVVAGAFAVALFRVVTGESVVAALGRIVQSALSSVS